MATGAADGQRQRPGDSTVYAKIAAETSCQALQGTFDQADATAQRSGRSTISGERWIEIGIAYMNAVDDRMKQIGCYR